MKQFTLLYLLFTAITANVIAQGANYQPALPKIGPAYNAPKSVKVDQSHATKKRQELCNDYHLGVVALFEQLEKIRVLEKNVAAGSAKLDKLHTELMHWNHLYQQVEKKRKHLENDLAQEKVKNTKLSKENQQQNVQLISIQASLDSINTAYTKVCAALESMKKENILLRAEVNTLQMRLNDSAKAGFPQAIRIYDQDFLDLERVKSNGPLKKMRFEIDFTVSKYIKMDIKKAKWEVALKYKNSKSLNGEGQLSVYEDNNFYHITGIVEFTGRKQLKKLAGLSIITLSDKNEEYRITKIFKVR